MGISRVAAAVVLIGLFGTSCDHDGDGSADPPVPVDGAAPVDDTGALPGETITTATATPNRPPRLAESIVVRSGPGRTVVAELPLEDPDGDRVEVTVDESVPGLTVADGAGGWRLSWSPVATGTTVTPLSLVDERGARADVEVLLRSSERFREDTLLALGDSVASGHGLDERDYLRGDDCWRDGDDAYPALVHAELVDRGDFATSEGLHLVACSGASLADLFDDAVTGGPADVAASGGRLSQVEWAVASNAEIVTLTAGANTLGFTDPWNYLDDGVLDEEELDRRLQRVGDDLDALLERLVEHTDSRLIVTNYHNPAATEPQGVDGCRASCFRQLSIDVVGALNDRLAATVAHYPQDRVVLVDVASRFDGHGAPNGLGPDSLRAAAPDWLREIVGESLEGVHPYCARGHDGTDDSWISTVDCVHPDARGHREIAAAVIEAITG